MAHKRPQSGYMAAVTSLVREWDRLDRVAAANGRRPATWPYKWKLLEQAKEKALDHHTDRE